MRLQLGTRGTGCDDPAQVKRSVGPGGSSKPHRTVSSANCSASTTSRMQAATFCGTRPITLPLPARAFRKAQAGTSEHLAEPWHTGLHTSHVVSHQSLRGSAAHFIATMRSTLELGCQRQPITIIESFRDMRKPFAERCALLIASPGNWLLHTSQPRLGFATRPTNNTSFLKNLRKIRTKTMEA